MDMRVNKKKLAWKLKRGVRDASYSLRPRSLIPQRYLGRLTLVAYIAVAAFTIFVISGGIFNVLEKPLAILPRGSGWTFIYRGSIHLQTLNESIIAAIIYFMGVVGLYILLQSTKLVYRPRQAYLALIIGLLVTLISVYYSIMMLQAKIGSSS
ncbi:MAG: hypothetical protein QW390_04390 [Candidatus Bathyarchaeia archaeon]